MTEDHRNKSFERRLCASPWEFSHASGAVIAPTMQFQARGGIDGHIHHNEVRWGLHDGSLEFISASGVVSSRFTEGEVGEDGQLT